MTTGMPTTTKRQPSLVMQLMMVNGSFISFIIKLIGRNSSPSNLNIDQAVAHRTPFRTIFWNSGDSKLLPSWPSRNVKTLP